DRRARHGSRTRLPPASTARLSTTSLLPSRSQAGGTPDEILHEFLSHRQGAAKSLALRRGRRPRFRGTSAGINHAPRLAPSFATRRRHGGGPAQRIRKGTVRRMGYFACRPTNALE